MSSIATSIESFVPDLKKNPRLAYRKFKNRVLRETRASCNEITETTFIVHSYLTQTFINSFAPDDISELSDDVYGMMNVTLRQCYVHSEAKYGRLDQSDFDKIFETLQSPKL
eukprot:gene29014-38388_t